MAINLQHITFSGEPILSSTVLTAQSNLGGGLTGAILNFFKNMVDSAVTPIRIKTLRRSLQEMPEAQFAQQLQQQLPQSPQQVNF